MTKFVVLMKWLQLCPSAAIVDCHNVLGTDVLMSILALRKLYCSRTRSGPKLFVVKASENQ